MNNEGLSRRDFLNLTARSLGGAFAASEGSALENYYERVNAIKVKEVDEYLQRASETVDANLGDSLEVVGLRVEKENGSIEIADNLVSVLQRDLNTFNGENETEKLTNQIDSLIEAVQSEAEAHGHSLIDNQIMDAAGSVISVWMIKNVFEKGGVTREDYARLLAFTSIAYLVGDEDRKTQLEHNAIETVDAVVTIGALAEIGNFFVLKRGEKGELADRLLEIAREHTPGLSGNELQQFMAEIQSRDPYLANRIANEILEYEGETVGHLIEQFRDEDIDLESLLIDIQSDQNGQSKVDKLRTLVVLSNTINPTLGSILTGSITAPLARQIATKPNGELDLNMVCTLQGYVPNNFALAGLGAIPGYHETVSNTVGKLPIVGKAFIGADIGPRLAISQVAGDHAGEVLTKLDQMVLPDQGLLLGGFAIEVATRLADLEGRPVQDVLRELVDPMKVANVKKMFKGYGLLNNIPDATLGRIQRSTQVVYNAFVNPHHEDHPHQKEIVSEHFGKLKVIAEDQEIKGTLKQKIQQASSTFNYLTDVHNWEHAVGDELTDIFKTLTAQSLAVPYIEGVGKLAVDQAEQILNNVDGIDPFWKNNLLSFARTRVFGLMSTSFDNFAANKADLKVAIAKISEQKAELGDKLGKRVSAEVKKGYEAAVIGGGALPVGNMPNLTMFPLSVYSLDQAKRNFLLRFGTELPVHAITILEEATGTLPEIPLEWFVTEDTSH